MTSSSDGFPESGESPVPGVSVETGLPDGGVTPDDREVEEPFSCRFGWGTGGGDGVPYLSGGTEEGVCRVYILSGY